MQKFTGYVVGTANDLCGNVPVTVYYRGTTVKPTNIYSDDGVTVLANPITANNDGSYSFFAPNGRYDISIPATNRTAASTTGITLFDISDSGASAKIENIFGTLTINGALTASPANSSITLSPTGTGTVTINPATAGTMDNVAIGNTTRGSGKFTTLDANAAATFASNGLNVGSGQLNIASGNVSMSGNLVVSGAGPHAIGITTSNAYQVLHGGSFTGITGFSGGYGLQPNITAAVSSPAAGMNMQPTLNKAGSGTHSDFSTLVLDAPIIGAGAAALTNASTIKITGAPSGATNNRAFWVAAGLSQFDGALSATSTLAVTGTTTLTGNLLSAANGTVAIGAGANGFKQLYIDYTNTATVGAVTINKAAGRVNIAAAGTSVVVTNSLVTAASKVFASVSQADGTAYIKNVVPAAGSFTITLGAAATSQVSIDFLVVNAD